MSSPPVGTVWEDPEGVLVRVLNARGPGVVAQLARVIITPLGVTVLYAPQTFLLAADVFDVGGPLRELS